MPHPVLILPGIGGSVLVKTGQEKKRLFKEHVIDNRWMNIAPMSPARMNLWRHDNAATLRRDGVTGVPLGITQEEEGIRALQGLQGVCNIVPEFDLLARPYQELLNNKFHYKYFGGFVDTLVATGAFQENENLQALPYDFRRVLDPHYRKEMFCDMKRMIEAQNRPVVIVGHSLGAILFKWFLTVDVDAKWIKKHVRRFFVVNAPFGGSNTALKAVVSGEYFVPIFSKQFHSSLQLNSGIIMCFPNSYGYLPHEELAIVTGAASTMSAITPMTIARHQVGDAFDAWRALYQPHLDEIMEPLVVPTHIVTCTPTIETLKTFKLRELRELREPREVGVGVGVGVGGGAGVAGVAGVADVEEIAYEVGDSQVSKRSLAVAYDLFNRTSMIRTTIDGCNHINIVSDPRFVQLVINESCTD